MLNAVEALLFGGSDQFSVSDECRRRIAVISI
jgi:hypothetical protein